MFVEPDRAAAGAGGFGVPECTRNTESATAGHGLVAAVLTGCGCDGTIANTLNLPAGV